MKHSFKQSRSITRNHFLDMNKKRVNIVAVSKRLGHANIETTLKTYAHLLKDTDKEMMSIIAAETVKSHKQK